MPLPGRVSTVISSAAAPGRAGAVLAGSVRRPSSLSSSSSRPAQGIDISHWEDAFDPRNAKVPIDFAIFKASEGRGFIDPQFEDFYKSSRGVVPILGAYHYLRTSVSVGDQVATFLKAIAGKDFDILAVDVESYGNKETPMLAQMARDFIQQVELVTGKPVILYTNESIYKWFNKPGDENIPLWIASPGVEKPGVENWSIWQVSWSEPSSLFGIPYQQGVDFNYFAGSPAQMAAWVKSLKPSGGGANALTGYTPAIPQQYMHAYGNGVQATRTRSLIDSMTTP